MLTRKRPTRHRQDSYKARSNQLSGNKVIRQGIFSHGSVTRKAELSTIEASSGSTPYLTPYFYVGGLDEQSDMRVRRNCICSKTPRRFDGSMISSTGRYWEGTSKHLPNLVKLHLHLIMTGVNLRGTVPVCDTGESAIMYIISLTGRSSL